MPQQSSSSMLWIALTAVAAFVIGGGVGFYIGYDQGWEGSIQAAKQTADAYAEVETNPLNDVKTNPYSDVKTNPFE